MTSYLLDTNILLRHVLRDEAEQSAKAFSIVRDIEAGRLLAWTSDLVIAESVFVLSSRRAYNRSPQEIASALLPLIHLPNLKMDRKAVVSRALELYAQLQVDFIDAYHVALMEQRHELHILSFDKDFDVIPGVIRLEEIPEAPL